MSSSRTASILLGCTERGKKTNDYEILDSMLQFAMWYATRIKIISAFNAISILQKREDHVPFPLRGERDADLC